MDQLGPVMDGVPKEAEEVIVAHVEDRSAAHLLSFFWSFVPPVERGLHQKQQPNHLPDDV